MNKVLPGLLLTLFVLIFSLNLTGQDTASLHHDLSRRERKAQDKFIIKNLAGKWKDQNSTISFFANNRYLTEFDDGLKQTGFWEIKKGKLILTEHPSYVETVYKISSFSTTKMEYQHTGSNPDGILWIAKKISSL